MTFDSPEDGAVSEGEREAAEQNARIRLRLWQRRALYSTGAFVLSCALVYPFVDGRRLSAQGEAIKQGLLVLWMALFLICLYCTLLLWGAWRLLRDLKSGNI
jgi:hypothetical protein